MRACDGTYRWLHSALGMDSPFVDGPRERHGISTDVTELKVVEEAARRAAHLREEVLATVAHDLRTLLHIIVATVSTLRRRGGGDPPCRATDRMTRLIADLAGP